jgi:LruC domain-containing protein
MKNIFVILLVLGFTQSCTKKKDDGMFLLGLLAGGSSNPSASTASNPPAGSQVEQIDGTTSVIHLPTSPDAAPEEPIPTSVSTEVQDLLGTSTFTFQTNNTVPISIQVSDEAGPVQGAVVTILDPEDALNPDILFQQTTDATGTASGSIIVSNGVTNVVANINLGNEIVTTNIATTAINPSTGSTQDVLSIDRDLVVSGSHNPTSFFTDTDGDGIADASDDYPDDATRSTMTRFPKSGVNTVAFEDLFPNAGDADLNDYVLFFSIEEDLNAQGNISRIRGSYQHVARGAGYTHTLNLKMNAGTGAKLSKIIYNDAGATLDNKGEVVSTLSASDIANGFELLPKSDKTLSVQNNSASHANNLKLGYTVSFELSFDQPVPRAKIGSAPYDLYIYVINTKKNIHFPGKYFDVAGKDQFLDKNGFPWAIIVPGKWKWPLESKDIRSASNTGYIDFASWANSKGVEKKTWYLNVSDPSKVFPLPDDSNLAGYLAKAAQENWLIAAIALLISGLSIGYFLTRRNQGHLSN